MPPRPRPPILDLPPIRALAATVLAAGRATTTQARALAEAAVGLAAEVEWAREGRTGLGAKGVRKTSADALLVQRVMQARRLTMSAVAQDVEVSVSVLSRANFKPVPRRVRGLLRAMVGEPGGEEPVAE